MANNIDYLYLNFTPFSFSKSTELTSLADLCTAG